jgi:hypothetical protein
MHRKSVAIQYCIPYLDWKHLALLVRCPEVVQIVQHWKERYPVVYQSNLAQPSLKLIIMTWTWINTYYYDHLYLVIWCKTGTLHKTQVEEYPKNMNRVLTQSWFNYKDMTEIWIALQIWEYDYYSMLYTQELDVCSMWGGNSHNLQCHVHECMDRHEYTDITMQLWNSWMSDECCSVFQVATHSLASKNISRLLQVGEEERTKMATYRSARQPCTFHFWLYCGCVLVSLAC